MKKGKLKRKCEKLKKPAIKSGKKDISKKIWKKWRKLKRRNEKKHRKKKTIKVKGNIRK